MKLEQPHIGQKGMNGQVGIDLQSAARSFNQFSTFDLSRASSAYRANINYRKRNNYKGGGADVIPYSQFEKINLSSSGKWTISKFDTLQADVLFDQGWNIGFPALPMGVGKATARIYSIT